MRNLILAIVPAVSLTLGGALVSDHAQAAPLLEGAQLALSSGPIENVQLYFYGGRRYCWYPVGWHGPGWYWCGYAWRRGFGWGGGYGWRGWGFPGVRGPGWDRDRGRDWDRRRDFHPDRGRHFDHDDHDRGRRFH